MITYDKMIEQLKSEKFYLPDDEAGELFVSMCRLCKHFASAGIMDTRVETLLKWIKDYCDEQKQWCQNNCQDVLGIPFDKLYFITGINAFNGIVD